MDYQSDTFFWNRLYEPVQRIIEDISALPLETSANYPINWLQEWDDQTHLASERLAKDLYSLIEEIPEEKRAWALDRLARHEDSHVRKFVGHHLVSLISLLPEQQHSFEETHAFNPPLALTLSNETHPLIHEDDCIRYCTSRSRFLYSLFSEGYPRETWINAIPQLSSLLNTAISVEDTWPDNTYDRQTIATTLLDFGKGYRPYYTAERIFLAREIPDLIRILSETLELDEISETILKLVDADENFAGAIAGDLPSIIGFVEENKRWHLLAKLIKKEETPNCYNIARNLHYLIDSMPEYADNYGIVTLKLAAHHAGDVRTEIAKNLPSLISFVSEEPQSSLIIRLAVDEAFTVRREIVYNLPELVEFLNPREQNCVILRLANDPTEEVQKAVSYILPSLLPLFSGHQLEELQQELRQLGYRLPAARAKTPQLVLGL